MNDLFGYLHLLNEARSVDKNDEELYKRQQKVCDAIEESLGIQEYRKKPNTSSIDDHKDDHKLDIYGIPTTTTEA